MEAIKIRLMWITSKGQALKLKDGGQLKLVRSRLCKPHFSRGGPEAFILDLMKTFISLNHHRVKCIISDKFQYCEFNSYLPSHLHNHLILRLFSALCHAIILAPMPYHKNRIPALGCLGSGCQNHKEITLCGSVACHAESRQGGTKHLKAGYTCKTASETLRFAQGDRRGKLT
jgi:hypothetical protein